MTSRPVSSKRIPINSRSCESSSTIRAVGRMVRAMDGPVDVLLMSSSQSSCGFRSTAGAFPSPPTRREIRAGGEGQLKKAKPIRVKNQYAPKSGANGTGLSSRFRCVVLKQSRCAKIQTSTLPLGALHRRYYRRNPLLVVHVHLHRLTPIHVSSSHHVHT